MNPVPKIWEDLKKLGFHGSITSFDELYKWMRRMNLSYIPPKIKIINNDYLINGYVYKDIDHFMSGAFGNVYKAIRVKDNDELPVYIKGTPKYPRTLILEGFLQQTARAVLEHFGFLQCIPEIIEFLQHPNNGVLCAIEAIPNSFLISEYLQFYISNDYSINQIEHFIIEIIAQVATYMAILESELNFNHRDLKGNNIIMISPTNTWSKCIGLGNKTWKIQSTCKVIVVDFGMSCIGNINSKVAVSADQRIMMIDNDFCPKEGRDMFLLFVNLWNTPEIRDVLTPKVHALFDKWLRDNTKSTWAKDFLSIPYQLLKNNFETMCEHLNKKSFRSESCNPIRILQDISEVFPDIVSFTG